MTDGLEMPSPEEAQKPELRMVVVPLELPKLIWWTFDAAEKKSGTSTAESLAYLLKQKVMEETLIALLKNIQDKL